MKTISNTVIRTLSSQEREAGDNVMRQCLAIKKSESVLIVTDKRMLETEAAIFYETAKAFSDKVTLIVKPTGTEHAQEPPEEVSDLMNKSDVAFLITTHSLSHTKARHEACRTGTRIASLPTITHDTILRTLTMDYKFVANLSKKIAAAQTAGNTAHIKSPGGTDFRMDLSGRSAIADTGLFTNPGDSGNLPAGEAFIAPVEGTSEGTIVFDGCFADIVLDGPLKVIVKNGYAVDITGGQAARILIEKLSRVGKEGFNIAEFGIGTNKNAQLNDSLLEVEKVYGTTHIALGNNATFGGEVDVPFHSDGVILKPTITIDKTEVVRDGEFTI